MKNLKYMMLALLFLSGCATVPPECKRYTDNWDSLSKEEKRQMRYTSHCYKYLSKKQKEDRQHILVDHYSSLIMQQRAKYDAFIAGLAKGQPLDDVRAKAKALEAESIIIYAQRDPNEKEPNTTKLFGKSRIAVKGFALIFTQGKLDSWEENNY